MITDSHKTVKKTVQGIVKDSDETPNKTDSKLLSSSYLLFPISPEVTSGRYSQVYFTKSIGSTIWPILLLGNDEPMSYLGLIKIYDF